MITSSAEIELFRTDPNLIRESGQHYSFAHGNKHLSLSISYNGTKDRFEGLTYVDTLPGIAKTSGSTTIVYEAAREALKEAAQSLQHSVVYELITANANMRLWALNEGARVFEWDRIVLDDGENFRARKLFFPK